LAKSNEQCYNREAVTPLYFYVPQTTKHMHSKLDPEDRVLDDILEDQEEYVFVPKLDGYACPYPRRKLRTPTKDETYYSR
jgi:hypothetical protein